MSRCPGHRFRRCGAGGAGPSAVGGSGSPGSGAGSDVGLSGLVWNGISVGNMVRVVVVAVDPLAVVAVAVGGRAGGGGGAVDSRGSGGGSKDG